MPNLCHRIALIALLAPLFSGAAADDYYAWQSRLQELDGRCENARRERLAPVRRKLTEECERERQLNPAISRNCAIETSTYGDRGVNGRGAVLPGQFYDLPECIQADRARQERDASQSWRQ